jgi:glycosyltransferase involved in cell wall biosynthesis
MRDPIASRTPRKKKISVITPVFNEEATVRECYARVQSVFGGLAERYDYEHIFADNCSTDGTLAILKDLAARDSRVKVLSYSRNFGAEKSGFAAMKYMTGDAGVGIPADLQEPPEMIPKFAELWEQGYEVVYGVYKNREAGFLARRLRHFYYWLVDRLSPEPLPHDFSGFGLIDRKVVDEVVKIDDFAPYIRGMIATVGFRQIGIPYERAPRKAGKSMHGVLFLLNFGMNGIISHSLVPIRLATLTGMFLSFTSILLAFGYALLKIFKWNIQAPGATTTIVLVLFFSGIQLLFLGILGEYVGAIHGQVRRRPFVIVREKINFGDDVADLSSPGPRHMAGQAVAGGGKGDL